MDIKGLMEAGLTKNQSMVYIEIVKHPAKTGGEISKNLSIDRSFVYSIINSLIRKGLVSYNMVNGAKLFYPADPENLLKEFEEKRETIIKSIEELRIIKEKTRVEKSVSVYEGKTGLKAYIRDFLTATSFVTFGGGGKLNILEALKYNYPHYLKELNEKTIRGKLITSPENVPVTKELYKKSKVEIKTLQGLKSGVSFTIFKNKLAIYSAEEKPFVVIIEDESIAKALKDYFDNLWALIK